LSSHFRASVAGNRGEADPPKTKKNATSNPTEGSVKCVANIGTWKKESDNYKGEVEEWFGSTISLLPPGYSLTTTPSGKILS
jgi:hypothetical protein